MQIGARQVPPFLGAVAVALAASAVVAFLVENANEVQQLTWSLWLWVGGCVAALVALLVGFVADRRGFSIRLALFALLMLGGLVGLFLLGAGTTA